MSAFVIHPTRSAFPLPFHFTTKSPSAPSAASCAMSQSVLTSSSLLSKPSAAASAAAPVPDLAKLHPDNRHVRDKIRQQLQVLRGLGLLEFLGAGSYRLL